MAGLETLTMNSQESTQSVRELTMNNSLTATISPETDNLSEIKDFIGTYLNDWEKSEQRLYMDTCERYYANKNDILDSRRWVIGRGADNRPTLEESKLLANNQLCHNFLQKLVKQKLGYVVSKPFTIDIDDPEDEHGKDMIKAVKPYYTKFFHKMIKNCARDAIVDGLGWVQVYYDAEGNLGFKRIPSREVAPIWEDIDHEILSGVIRKYTKKDYTGGKVTEREYVEYYTKDTAYYFVKSNGNLEINTNISNTGTLAQYYAYTRVDNVINVTPMTWGRVPFIPFKYNSEETTLLSKIKSLIDDYDRKTSTISNLIDDTPNSLKVIKNYDGASREEFVRNMNQYRTMFVQGDGDAKALESDLGIAEADIHLQRLREDIYEFGQGVNTADKDIRDTSGVALRFLYADLDMDCNDWTPELETSIMSILDFILEDIKEKTSRDYSDVKYSILFNTDVIINETETITNCFTSKGVISDETIAANHPWTRDVDKEMENMRQEDIDELTLERDYGTPSDTIDNQIRTSGTTEE